MSALAVAVAMITAGCAEGRRAIPVVPIGSGARTQIFAGDGTLITEVVPEQNRLAVRLADIPLMIQNAVIAIEDERFWEHDGVDIRSLLRAASTNSRSGGRSQGGSTITQQYVKIALLSPEKTVQRKIEEASLALQLERNYSKEFILEQYLNTIFLGNRSYGIAIAVQNYFGHAMAQTTIAEAALLAGLVQSPSRLDPYDNPERAVARRSVVLQKMADLGYITETQRAEADSTTLTLAPAAGETAQPPYPAPHFVEEVKRFIRTDPRFGATEEERTNLLVNGGLKVYTTVDLKMQAIAERTLTDRFPNQARAITDPNKSPDAALVSLDPRTGFVKAMVGGYDYFDTDVTRHSYAQVNLAVGKGRQTGSTFKVVALAAAMNNGIKMSDKFAAPGSATVRIPGYAPWEVSGDPLGQASLTECIIDSANTCFANLVADPRVGPQKITETATLMGIDTSVRRNAAGRITGGFSTVPSAVLGANDSTVLDMTSATGSFATRGAHMPATLVTKVVGPGGNVLYQQVSSPTQIVPPEAADTVTTALEGVLTRGTASGNGIGRPAAGKTGTTQDKTDAWFIGFTPDLATGIWTGYAQTKPSGGLRKVGDFGGRLAAPIWSDYMKEVLEDSPALAFAGGAVAVDPEDPTAPPATTTTLKQNTAIFQPQRNPGTTTMPSVTGLTITEATAAIRKAGLTMKRINIEVPGALGGQVIGQSPAAGSTAIGGGTVIVETTPGKPPPTAVIPDVLNQAPAAVRPGLERTGWTVTVASAGAPAGTVLADGLPPDPGEIWSVSPAVGSLTPDGKVTLTVQP